MSPEENSGVYVIPINTNVQKKPLQVGEHPHKKIEKGRRVSSYLAGDDSLQQLSRHSTTQSWLGSKKKAACNIDIFNLKILDTNMELTERTLTSDTLACMAIPCHRQTMPKCWYATDGIRNTLA